MSQTESFALTPRDDLLEHYAQLDSLYQRKLEELRAIGAQMDTLTATIGIHALQGAGVEPEIVTPPHLRAVA